VVYFLRAVERSDGRWLCKRGRTELGTYATLEEALASLDQLRDDLDGEFGCGCTGWASPRRRSEARQLSAVRALRSAIRAAYTAASVRRCMPILPSRLET
jgi:hypothetical protein